MAGREVKIGITGGIGSGKSAVSAYLRSLGETVLCADEAARQVMEPGQAGERAVRAVFGDGFFLPDGSLDRKALGRDVFGDSGKRRLLEDALHPLIIDRVMRGAEAAADRVFIDAALLIQAGLGKQMDAVWLVTADRETRIRRVMERDGLDEKSVLQRIESQPDDGWMARFADEVIQNNDSLARLHGCIDELLRKYTR